MRSRHIVEGLIVAVIGIQLVACGSNPLSLPPAPVPAAASLGSEAATASVSSDLPVDVYARVARGALRCWFGAEGSLKKTHVFHAKVDPPSAGGAAEISVHTRDLESGGAGHAALRAYRINITPSAGGSLVEAQNVRFPEAQGAEMGRDVARWVRGDEGCSVVGTGGLAVGEPQVPSLKVEAKASKSPVKRP